MRLDELKDTQSALISGYAPEMPSERRERFEDLGLTIRARITRERSAPLGDPLVFRIRGTRLCIRRADARLIRVEENTQ